MSSEQQKSGSFFGTIIIIVVVITLMGTCKEGVYALKQMNKAFHLGCGAIWHGR